MNEIRLHGRGGLGTVKAAETIVYAAVMDGKYGNSIPFFGFERQGAPVTAFVRIDDKPIRPKNRVYNPNAVIVLDPTIMNAVDVFEGIEKDSILVINTTQEIEDIQLPENIKKVVTVDATSLSIELIGKPITNTIMLGAFVKATKWVSLERVSEKVLELWGEKNKEAVIKGYSEARVFNL